MAIDFVHFLINIYHHTSYKKLEKVICSSKLIYKDVFRQVLKYSLLCNTPPGYHIENIIILMKTVSVTYIYIPVRLKAEYSQCLKNKPNLVLAKPSSVKSIFVKTRCVRFTSSIGCFKLPKPELAFR